MKSLLIAACLSLLTLSLGACVIEEDHGGGHHHGWGEDYHHHGW